MAISHSQPLLLLLLVSLFVLPALSIEFKKCYTGRHKFIDVKTVEISPDPVDRSGNANITITGYTSKDIPDGSIVELELSVWLPISTKTYKLCDVTACPVTPGPFALTFSNIFTQKETKKAKGYIVSVRIEEKPRELAMMCVVFSCKIKGGYASLLSQVTEGITLT